MFTQHDLIWTILVPGTIALLVSLCFAALKINRGGGALAMWLAFAIAFPAIYTDARWQLPRIPPSDSSGWLFVIAMLAGALGLVDALWHTSARWLRGLIFALSAAISLSLLLKFKFRGDWSFPQGAAIIAAFSILAGLWWFSLDWKSVDGVGDTIRSNAIVTPIILWMIGCSVGVVSMLVGIASYGKCSIALAAASASMIPALIWRRNSNEFLRGAPMIFSILSVTMLAGEHFLGSLELKLIGILSVAPLFDWLGRILPGKVRPWQRACVRVVFVLIPLCAALALAIAQFQREQRSEGSGDESGYNY
jgi:cellulose synthase/poly-beta-1,6-N-acetylglucosamine synthase-like glycosyltransferase